MRRFLPALLALALAALPAAGEPIGGKAMLPSGSNSTDAAEGNIMRDKVTAGDYTCLQGHVNAKGVLTSVATGSGCTGGTGSVTSVTAGSGLTASPNPIVGAGTISCVTAAAGTLGCAKPDGTTITASGGTFSAVNSGTVTSVGLSVPASSLFGVTGTPVTGSGTLGLTTTGTSGGIPYFDSSSTLNSSGALTSNLPVIGGGAGAAPSVGTRSGNTTAFVTTTGAQTSGKCVQIDANGNHVAASNACGSGASLEIPLAVGWVAGVNPNKAIIANIRTASTVQAIVGRVDDAIGAAGTVSVYKSPTGTACASGTVLHSGSLDANGTNDTNQTLTVTTSSLSAGDEICLSTTGTGWTTGSGIGGVTVFITTP